VPALGAMVFHEKLGTIEDKVARIQALAVELASYIRGADRDAVRSAATLAKADLTTGMVGEFPELQGIMGRYYALNEGESAEVADAIAEHYAPQGPADACPTRPVSVAVALADKLDTLVGFFGIGEKPTGSRDPFALRRAALGVIRIVLENGLRLPLGDVLARARQLYAGTAGFAADGGKLVGELLDFFADRLKVHLRDKGVRHDLISAVLAVSKANGAREDDLLRLVARAEALKTFLDSDDGANLLTAYRRASNIVGIEEKKDKASYAGASRPELLRQEEEKELARHLGESASGAEEAIGVENFVAAMEAMSRLRAPVDAFFDHVTVNCDEPDLRRNRLNLLSQFRSTMSKIADFGQIEG
jgi:glycyl-tRNA synthetase beta chain